jgi:hypothetical protein
MNSVLHFLRLRDASMRRAARDFFPTCHAAILPRPTGLGRKKLMVG